MMQRILQRVLGTLSGIVVAFVVVMLGEMLLHAIFPMPRLNTTDPASVEAAMRSAPFGAKLGLAIIYGLAAYLGGLTGCLASRWIWGGRVVVALLLALVVTLFLMLPHPMWVFILSVALVIFGGWVGVRAGIGQYVLRGLRRD